MFNGVFVTGTDTGVGKTVASAALLARYRHLADVRYWKPIQTGIEQDDDTGTVASLSGLPDRVFDAGVRLPRPLSPHLSARLAKLTIDVEDVVSRLRTRADDSQWIVEGAGGVLVPLNERDLMTDLMTRLALPVVIVSRSGLGTINHTLLTIEALRARQLGVAGVVIVGEPNVENRRAIEHYGQVTVLGELPVLSPLTTESLRAAADRLDPNGVLFAAPRGAALA